MTLYEVRISEPAEVDIQAIYDYLFLRDPWLADDWRDQLAHVADSLSTFPQRCSLAPENGMFDREIRQLWFGKRGPSYRLLYTIIEDEREGHAFVRILRVRHHAQNLLIPEDAEE